jgi:LPS-assembly protein
MRRARNTTFDVFGVPLAWIPWMVFPVKTERQTGLLFPEFSLGQLPRLRVRSAVLLGDQRAGGAAC